VVGDRRKGRGRDDGKRKLKRGLTVRLYKSTRG
jgi:hypothetical protein